MVTAAQATLMVQGGSNSGNIISLSGRPITMGRRSDNDIVVDETTVSRRHALILEGPDGFVLRDLSTTNGTYLNRDRIGHGEHKLNHGDRIRLAGSKVTYIFRQEGPSTVRMTTDAATTGTFEKAPPSDGAVSPVQARAEGLEADAEVRAKALRAEAYARAQEIKEPSEPDPQLLPQTGGGDDKPKLLGKDSDLFRLLQSKTGSVVTREEIADRLWPELVEAGLADQIIEQSIERLRANVEDDPDNPVHLITAGKLGYLLI